MTASDCIGTPVSWLRLERFALGEVPEDERRAIEAHLRQCDACRVCAEACAAPVEMPPLRLPTQVPAGSPASVVPLRPHAPRRARPLRPLGALAVTVVAVAAALALVVVARDDSEETHRTGVLLVEPSRELLEHDGHVGGADAAVVDTMVLSLLRERSGAVVENPGSFRVTDRFAVRITCRPGDEGARRVAVYQNGEWSTAVELGADARCGNAVRIPGAFRITKRAPADVCVLFGDAATTANVDLPAPAAIRDARCARVEPSPGDD